MLRNSKMLQMFSLLCLVEPVQAKLTELGEIRFGKRITQGQGNIGAQDTRGGRYGPSSRAWHREEGPLSENRG